ncbi:MAG: hypothetical protein IIC66_12625, partial [candidate division Zixibacteria bacterium]|nr:hypothetical protein [candidate division Zixibacteria bacterium]
FHSAIESRDLYDVKDIDKFPNSQRLENPPAHCAASHRIGNMTLAVTNSGTLGTEHLSTSGIDCFTGRALGLGCEVPKNSGVEYLHVGAYWIGAVVGRDTLVSVGLQVQDGLGEFLPDPSPKGDMQKRSIIDPGDREMFEGAISEEDFIAVYTDTVTAGVASDNFDNRRHIPIGIEITQRSYAWSYEYAENFVLFDFQVKNIKQVPIRELYIGIFIDGDVGAEPTSRYDDDLCGFAPSFVDTHLNCEFVDVTNLAWIADNDGDFDEGAQPAPNVTGVRIVRTPAESLEVSFNWWVSNNDPTLDFGPRERPGVGKLKEPFRDFGTGGLGTPRGDRNKYYVLRNQEFDYDQAYTGVIKSSDTFWIPPNQKLKDEIPVGFDTRYLLSFGPFEIHPGEKLPISFAYVAGLNFHKVRGNLANLPQDPDAFYENLNFKDFQISARWAGWIYDNPGVDTDGDGYAGEMRFCPIDSAIESVDSSVTPWDTVYTYTKVDTTFASGDGVPDFRGASPPPAPKLFVEPSVGKIRIHFNGYKSETTKDPFTRVVDFEGYRIYVARDDRSTSYSQLATYDRENYNKYTFNQNVLPPAYELTDNPFTYDELFNLYAFGDSTFDPLAFTRVRPYRHPLYPSDSQFYFESQGFNISGLTDPNGIIKVYPNQPYPSTLVLDSLPEAEKTPEGLPRYFEYEHTLENLLPTVPYWISVTAFDFGSPSSGLPPLETSVTLNTANVYPLETAEGVAQKNLEVFVYPNPYRIDRNYRQRGFEGLDTLGQRLTRNQQSDNRSRRIHFANLPAKCTISIYSLDGDLVREIFHDKNISDPNASHNTWNLITRNTQAVVSGLYYWTVENTETGD